MRTKRAPNSARKKPAGSTSAEMIEGLREFRDALKRGERIETRFTVRTVKLDLEPLLPSEHGARSVRSIRQKLGVSQRIFAQLLGVSVKLVQSWEQGTRKPEILARHVLDDISRSPLSWLGRLERAATGRVTQKRD